MGASKRAKAVRRSTEFNLPRLSTAIRPPRDASGVYAWTLERIRAARDAQMRGDFRLAVELGHAMRTDAAILTAQINRLAPARGLPVRLRAPRDNARGRRILAEAEAHFGDQGVGISRATITSINACLADHEIAIGYNVWTPREDGSRVDVELRYWPLEHCRWDPTTRRLLTRLEGGEEVEVCHGDGRWVVFSSYAHEPWKHGAILPAALTWASRAYGVRDLSKGTSRHADAKVIGTLPEGLSLQGADGSLSAEAAEMLELVKVIASADTPYGIQPFGAKVDYLVNSSTAWQVYAEVIKLGDRDAAKIYLGQDGSVNDSGGNYIKSKFLFGVRNDIVEGELRGAMEPAIRTGTIEPWAAVNFGDSEDAPYREWLLPDADEDARRESIGRQVKAYLEALTMARAAGHLTQDWADSLALDFGVAPLPVTAPPSSSPLPGAATAPASPAGAATPAPGATTLQAQAAGLRRLRPLP